MKTLHSEVSRLSRLASLAAGLSVGLLLAGGLSGSQAATSLAPLLETLGGLRVLEALPEGATLLQRLKNSGGVARLSAHDRWRLDQVLQDVHATARGADRQALRLIGEGVAGAELSSALQARLRLRFQVLLNDNEIAFAPELLANAPGSYGNLRGQFLRSNASSELVARFESTPFTSDVYTLHAVRTLQAEGAEFLARRVLGKTPDVLNAAVAQRTVRSSAGAEYRLESQILSHGTGRQALLSQVVQAREVGSGDLEGFFILQFKAGAQPGEISAYLELIKVDLAAPRARGLGSALYDELLAVSRAQGATHLKLNADWSGREVWAKKGFRFDPSTSVREGGGRALQRDAFRRNFERFLESQGLLKDALGVRREGQVQPLRSLESLREPADYLDVVALDGRKLKVDQYVDNYVIREDVESDVGIAFLMKPYFPTPNQRIPMQTLDDLAYVSDSAAFSWDGVLDLIPAPSVQVQVR